MHPRRHACSGKALRRGKPRLTPARRRVLELLLEDHRAHGAYDILARLQAEGLGAQPPTAYRALDFVVSHGFAHRIERLNAYIACTHSGGAHRPTFPICRKCESVAEAGARPVERSPDQEAEAPWFAMEQGVVELEELCPASAEAEKRA
ncbi:transcriptional repressor [Rhodophyticola porphyridii]|uniref:transcriptional repressor n=1 Tax=Rhodophyticola porphyridii TaxID=1852017 RepID=UPI002D77671C|nr:transcriptional repressor [Rhodophyticola porphyridii]